MKNYLSLLGLVAVALIGMTSKGPATNIGLASGSNILGQIPEAIEAQTVLDTLQRELDLQFQAKVSELQHKQQLYENEKSTLNEIVKVDKEAELQALQESILQFQQTAREAYVQKESELMAPILENFQSALETVAEDQRFTHIFNVDATNGSSLLLYAKDHARVDSLVIQKLIEVNIKSKP